MILRERGVMSKCKIVEPRPELYTGPCGMEVMQLLLYYGYERMHDITVLAAVTSKALFAWANGRVFVKCALQTFVKVAKQKPTISHFFGHVPTVSLLKTQPKIRLLTIAFEPAVECHRLEFVYHSALSVNFTPLIMVTYDGENGGVISRQTQSEQPSHIVAVMEFDLDNIRSRVSAIRIVARGHKQEITSL